MGFARFVVWVYRLTPATRLGVKVPRVSRLENPDLRKGTGMKSEKTERWIFEGVRWVARAGAVLLVLLWGAFFVEHLQEWFIQPWPNTPPPRVWYGQALHGLMLVGLLVALRWERIGAPLAILAALAFFIDKGPNGLLFFLITALPAAVLLGCRWWQQHRPVASLDENHPVAS